MKNFYRALLALPLAAQLFAGGFWIELGNPTASSEAMRNHAVLVARVSGCHEPAKAIVTATAEGIVNGERKTVQLKPILMSATATYSIQKEWPSEGRWAVKVVAQREGLTTSFIVRMDQDKFDRSTVKYMQGVPTAEQVAAVIRGDNQTKDAASL